MANPAPIERRPLGRTGLKVSAVCLGTMTWGRQNTEGDGHLQMDYALDRGIDFWDTAEMYAVPPTAETYGRTEEIIGSWFASRGKRDRVILASKVVGPGLKHIRGGDTKFDRANIKAALDGSLKRLRTDWIDLYQLHWPERKSNFFGKLGYVHDPQNAFTPIEETLSALADEVKAGRIRHIGLSNETAWGVMSFIETAERLGLPRIVSVQNPYSFLNRSFEIGLAECAMREDVGLLAYAPLGAGTLSGKYLDGARPPGSRRAIDPRPSRYDKPRAEPAVRAYLDIARRHGLDPCQMAISFVLSRPFTTAAIIGATSMVQLRADIDAHSVTLSADVLAEIEAVHAMNPNPCP